MQARPAVRLLTAVALVLASGAAFAQASLIRHHELADEVLVVKSERKLYLLKDGEVLREFDISLGLMPVGPKQREGDYRTPEGRYVLESRNPSSDYFLSIKVSYPNAEDRARAKALGVDPGGQIMIHGLPNNPRRDEKSYLGWDWTDGCIAVSNSDMIDIWLMTQDSTPIEIRP
ncbi:MAG TPA: L,D-transpeptidase family protein [Gammaproteobacteria bacterium]